MTWFVLGFYIGAASWVWAAWIAAAWLLLIVLPTLWRARRKRRERRLLKPPPRDPIFDLIDECEEGLAQAHREIDARLDSGLPSPPADAMPGSEFGSPPEG